jgi:formamidase
MAPRTHRVEIDRSKTLHQEPHTGHNRWHPDIPPILRVDPGDSVELPTRDALDGQYSTDTTPEEVGRSDLSVVHALTGPVYVNGAEPGDLLEVRIGEISPEPFGFTVQIPGFGFLRDYFPEPHIVRWDISDGYATSRDLPGVRIPGAPFMGVIGLAPSAELLQVTAERESALLSRGGAVLGPDPTGAVPSEEPIASTALRTIPPRETGGNLDIKQLAAGTTLLLPVFQEGALFSVGDAHFAQGDGEACGTAIEMAATFRASFELRKGVARERNIRDVQFSREDYFLDPRYSVPRRFYATTGMSVAKDGVNYSEDATLGARNALLNMIDYLVSERGFTRQQAYALCSVAVDLKISELVDVPNFVVSAFLPLDIFEG